VIFWHVSCKSVRPETQPDQDRQTRSRGSGPGWRINGPNQSARRKYHGYHTVHPSLSLPLSLAGAGRRLGIEVENNVLSLRGEKRETREEGDDRRYHLWERCYGSFERSFTLPRTVKTEEITAQFKDGILHVQMPKAPEAKSRKISIKSES
jgi:HSP20 family molecular chaperone IbpA